MSILGTPLPQDKRPVVTGTIVFQMDSPEGKQAFAALLGGKVVGDQIWMSSADQIPIVNLALSRVYSHSHVREMDSAGTTLTFSFTSYEPLEVNAIKLDVERPIEESKHQPSIKIRPNLQKEN